jgi:OmpA-OmpF porin, OOP family
MMQNMKKSILLLAMVSGLTLLSAQSAHAGNRPGAVSFTVGAAYDFWADKRNLRNTWLLPAAALAYNFDENWAIEGAWGTFGTSMTSSAGGGGVKGDLYTVDGLYRFGTYYNQFEPYVSAGVGVYHINPNGTNAENLGNINAGVGTEIFFDNSIALRGEVRDLYTMSGGKNDVTVGFGVSYLFGGNTPAPVTAPYKGEAPAAPTATKSE